MLVNPTVDWLAPLFRPDKPVLQVPPRSKLPKNDELHKRNLMPDFPIYYDILLLELGLPAAKCEFSLRLKQNKQHKYNCKASLIFLLQPWEFIDQQQYYKRTKWQVCMTNPFS